MIWLTTDLVSGIFLVFNDSHRSLLT